MIKRGKLVGYISGRDRRIADELTRYLPGQPSLVSYLDQAIRQTRGTVFTAREMGELLAQEKTNRMVSWHDTKRLGVHADMVMSKQVMDALQKVRPMAFDEAAIFLIRLCCYREDIIPSGATTIKELSELNLPFPEGSNVDQYDLLTFKRIFLCAVAMLAGINIDPCVASEEQILG